MLMNLKNYLRSKLEGILKKQQGATMVEYGLMVALIAVVSILVVTSMGNAVWKVFDSTNTGLGKVSTTSPAATNPVAAPS